MITKITAGNDFSIKVSVVHAQYETSEQIWVDFDIVQCKDVHVNLICTKHQTVIPLEWSIDESSNNVILCDIEGRWLHAGAVYGLEITGFDSEDKAWRYYDNNLFMVVNNTSQSYMNADLMDEPLLVNAKASLAVNTIIGPQGPQGDIGPQGERGTDGTVSFDELTPEQKEELRGPQGEIGLTGPQGDIGDTGPQGETGAQGPQGEKGQDGINGQDGAQGPQGETGATGETGAQGPQGEKGDQGETGPQGEKGQDGINGQDGAQGPQGETGQQGETGATGETGQQGPQGEIGLTGPQGEKGQDGINGQDGAQGPQGDTGAQGPQGDIGETGPQGPAGEAASIDSIYYVNLQWMPYPQNNSWQGKQAIEFKSLEVWDLSTSTRVYNASFSSKDPAVVFSEIRNQFGIYCNVCMDNVVMSISNLTFTRWNGYRWLYVPQTTSGFTLGNGTVLQFKFYTTEIGGPPQTGICNTVMIPIMPARDRMVTSTTNGLKIETSIPATPDSNTLYIDSTNQEIYFGSDLVANTAGGPQGPQGAIGETGQQGETGVQGPQGEKGQDGINGQDGAQGPQGEIGLTGPQGDTGTTGETGPQGDTGVQGPQGEIGPQGPAGEAAAASVTSVNGQTGAVTLSIPDPYINDTNPMYQYFTITPLTSGTLTCTRRLGLTFTLQYKVNYSDQWVNWPIGYSGGAITLIAGHKYYFKGTTPELSDIVYNTQFGGTAQIELSGNLLSLLYGDDFIQNINGELNATAALRRIFYNHTGIISAKNLVIPIGVFQNRVFEQMFLNCINLEYGPQLLFTNENDYTDSCKEMFAGCTSLKYLKCTLVTNTAPTAFTNWLQNVSATGTFVKSDNMTQWALDSVSGIPTGWTVLNESDIEPSLNYETVTSTTNGLKVETSIPATPDSNTLYIDSTNQEIYFGSDLVANAGGGSGTQGPQGETGAKGPIGPQGVQGDLGPQGPQGEGIDAEDFWFIEPYVSNLTLTDGIRLPQIKIYHYTSENGLEDVTRTEYFLSSVNPDKPSDKTSFNSWLLNNYGVTFEPIDTADSWNYSRGGQGITNIVLFINSNNERYSQNVLAVRLFDANDNVIYERSFNINEWSTTLSQGTQGPQGATGVQGPQGATGAQGPAGEAAAGGDPGFIKLTNGNNVGLVNSLSTNYDANIGNFAIIENGYGFSYDKMEASGACSHAEGYATKATGAGSHAEGNTTRASHFYSHAEGSHTVSSGNSTHAEGQYTTASGGYSHAEGYHTVATNIAEHAEGYYNVSTKTNTMWGDAGNTLHSIGNGNYSVSNVGHNAFEVKQNGDIYYSDTEKIDGSTVHYYDAPMRKLQDAMVTSTTNGLKFEIVASLPAAQDATTVYLVTSESALYYGSSKIIQGTT